MDLQRLSDRAEIADVLTTYTRAVDRKEYAAAAAAFTGDAVLDYSAAGGPVTGPVEALAWVAQMMAVFDRWQHVLGQLEYTFDGPDHARVTAYFTNPLVLVEEGVDKLVEVGGYYHHELARTPDGWRSTHMVDDLVWTR